MNFRTTLIVGILMVLLGAFAYFYEYKGEEKRKEAEEKSKTLLEFKKEDIAQLKLETQGQTIEVSPGGKDAWQITTPVRSRADESAVGRILSSLEKVKYKTIVDEKPSDIAQYELDHPKTVVHITLKNGPEKTIRIGGRNPVESVHYLSVDGDPRVYTLDGDLADSAAISLLDLRDKKLTDFSSDKVTSLRLQTPKLELEFRKESGVWKMLKPVQSPASDAEVNSLLSSLEFLRATGFVDMPSEDTKAYGLDSPSGAVEIELDKGMKQRIVFGSTVAADVYCRVGDHPTIAKVSDSFSAVFGKPLQDWREKKLLVFNRFDVEELRIKSEGKDHAFKKGAEEKWMQESPVKGEVPEEKLQGLLEKLESAEIERYGDTADLKGTPSLEIWMTLKDWQNTITKKHLAFGAVEGNQQLIRNDDYNTVVFISGAVQVGFLKDLAEIKPAAPPKK